MLHDRALGIVVYSQWTLAQQRPVNSRDKLRDMRVLGLEARTALDEVKGDNQPLQLHAPIPHTPKSQN